MTTTPSSTWTDLATALLERQVLRQADKDNSRADKTVAAAFKSFSALDGTDEPIALTIAFAELTATEAQVLAVCAAVETDRRLQRLVASLTADPTNFRLDVALLVALLGGEVLEALKPDARLQNAGLIEIDAFAPLAAARITVPQLVAWGLLGEVVIDPALPVGTTALTATAAEHDLDHPLRLLVHGPDRVRRIQTAVKESWGAVYLVATPPSDDTGWRVLLRQCAVYGMSLALEVDQALDPLARRWLARSPWLPVSLLSAQPLALEDLPDYAFTEVAAAAERVGDDEWKNVFPDAEVPPRHPTATQLSALGHLSTDGRGALARLASGSLLKHARRVVPSATWDDLVLPATQSARLRQLVDRYRFRSTVHDDWGLKLYPSPGVVTLFSGISGTGKTTAAEVIAHELGIDMFRVDLSALVSKYIGETEKNLEEIFSAAHAGEYLLLFDEADSLFGNRSAVTDSKDRYANMEVSYLLQRLETYDGFVVLTSNFQGNIDDAFLRRIHASIHFQMPAPEDRERIWDRCLGGAPRADDLDLGYVAKTFEIAGGAIRNSSLTAAFIAASKGTPVGMVEVLEAILQEYGKLRQRVTRAQLGPWAQEFGAI